MSFFEDVISYIQEHKPSKDELAKHKIVLARKHKLDHIPTDIEILLNTPTATLPGIKGLLQSKPMRSASGVSVIAIMTEPARCPHGKCAMCPGGIGSEYGDVPQSYTGHEPATMRGKRNDYDPYLQVMNRLEQYIALGHNPEKAEVIIMGGTFPATAMSYQDSFVLFMYKALNDFSRLFYTDGSFALERFKEFFLLPGSVNDKERATTLRARLLETKNKDTAPGREGLLSEQEYNHHRSSIKCVGLTVETKPDWGREDVGKRLLAYGCTRVELGVQTVYNDALLRVHRGHGSSDNIASIRELRDLGFKLNFHLMPGLPGVDREADIAGLKQIFSDPDYRPDMIKIYPCMVMPGTPLWDEWKAGKYTPLSTAEAADIIAEAKHACPPWCRIMRVQRDIPTKMSDGGVDRNNLRQMVGDVMKKKGYTCHCIRCREIGRAEPGKTRIETITYEASGGTEHFIQMLSEEGLVGFCRLRFSSAHDDSGMVRELHIYSQALGIGGIPTAGESQHRGHGSALLLEAERLSLDAGKKRMLVISGVGARGYYEKRGYTLIDHYMEKAL
ncbi:MAG: tRNA uridine(34) 5-carboxymethylaminomethyl modification radical SAM/GNAT enzyme Elp3 [Nanoarchaeota archaeon]